MATTVDKLVTLDNLATFKMLSDETYLSLNGNKPMTGALKLALSTDFNSPQGFKSGGLEFPNVGGLKAIDSGMVLLSNKVIESTGGEGSFLSIQDFGISITIDGKGGSANQVLASDGNGYLKWYTIPSGASPNNTPTYSSQGQVRLSSSSTANGINNMDYNSYQYTAFKYSNYSAFTNKLNEFTGTGRYLVRYWGGGADYNFPDVSVSASGHNFYSLDVMTYATSSSNSTITTVYQELTSLSTGQKWSRTNSSTGCLDTDWSPWSATISYLTNVGEYGFYNAGSYYESSNKQKPTSASTCILKFYALQDNASLTLDYISNDGQYGYGVFGELDTVLSATYDISKDNLIKNCSGESSTETKQISYTGISAGQHFIYIKFVRPTTTATASGNGSLRFSISSSENISFGEPGTFKETEVVTNLSNGLTPRLISSNTSTLGDSSYILASTNGVAPPSWYKLSSATSTTKGIVTLGASGGAAAYSHTHAKSEVGLGNVDNVKQYSATNPPPNTICLYNVSLGFKLSDFGSTTKKICNVNFSFLAYQNSILSFASNGALSTDTTNDTMVLLKNLYTIMQQHSNGFASAGTGHMIPSFSINPSLTELGVSSPNSSETTEFVPYCLYLNSSGQLYVGSKAGSGMGTINTDLNLTPIWAILTCNLFR